MLKANYHTHTTFCDGDNTAEQMVQRALDLQFDHLGFSGHMDEEIYMGTINCELGVRLREEASTTSDKKGLLRLGDVVVAIERVGDWSRVQKGKNSGYVMNKYVDFYPQTISSLKYVSQSGSSEYTIGYPAQDYLSGADRPADIFLDYLTSGGSLDNYDNLVEYATVSTDSDDVTLNLRESPNTESAILDVLKNGAQVRVLTHSEEWSQVSYDGATGYLLNRYLEFWNGGENALQEKEEDDEPVIVEEVDQIEHAVVDCDSAKKAAVYAEDSADAKVLGGLANGTKVDVLQTRDGWSRISLQGHEGYMREQDLKFLVEGVEA